jgi:hypothetical protein
VRGLLCLIAVGLLVLPATATPHARPQVIKIGLTDKGCSVSPKLVGFGNTHFNVTNTGRRRHGFTFAGHKTGFLKRGQKSLIDLDFVKPGSYRYFCTTPGRVSSQGRLRIGNTPGPSESDDARLTRIAYFSFATVVTAPPSDEHRLAVGQLDGLVSLLEDGTLLGRPFLDLRSHVGAEGEKGFLGLAFAPDYSTSGLLYVYYNDKSGNLHLDEFRRGTDPDTVDPATRREVLFLHTFSPNHNGGHLQFGPDGYLYAFVGDGGDDDAHPVGLSGQDRSNLAASILRIDPRQQPDGAPYGIPADNPFVAVPNVRPEVWAYGLRNPWRGWFDTNGDLYIADVGGTWREEVDFVPAGQKGLNFGWPCFEGSTAAQPDFPVSCDATTAPIYEYGHEGGGCSIIGGVVVHDPRLPSLEGYFLFSDLCDGKVRKLFYENGFALVRELGLVVPNPLTFGVDGLGRVYVSSANGQLYRLDPP